MNHFITTESITAHALCSRRAFFVLRGEPEGSRHEYERVLDERAAARRSRYLDDLPGNELPTFQRDNAETLLASKCAPARAVAVEDLVAACDALVKKAPEGGKAHARYEPHLLVGTYVISREQKLALAYAGYVVGQTKRYLPAAGFIVPMDGRPRLVRLPPLYPDIRSIISSLRRFADMAVTDAPPLYLSHKCVTCPFHDHCVHEAEEADSLTLLERMSPKLLRRYARKGVFTVNQLSYLFKPRRRRKRSPAAQPSFNIELQALAIRTNKIYLHEPPTLEEQPVELYLDIEGIPDQDFHYLIGLLIKNRDSVIIQSFWADTVRDERRMFKECVDAIKLFPDAPIYHYGSYEPRAFQNAAKKHRIDCAAFIDNLVNVNSFVFGKIYFPTRSNRLKDIGAFVGASWSATDPSGLQSIAWRYRWEDTGEEEYKEMLLSYNHEDCRAVRLLTQELQKLASSAHSRPDVDFPSTSKAKRSTTETGRLIHDSLDTILRSAHMDYQQKRIKLRSPDGTVHPEKQLGRPGHAARKQSCLPGKVGRVIQVPCKRTCPRCGNRRLRRARRSEHSMFDLKVTRNGFKKTVVKYVGYFAYCPVCHRYFPPPGVKRLRGRLFARSFLCWTTYLRVELRLPYHHISQVINAMFAERVSSSTAAEFSSVMAQEYRPVEKLLLERLLESPVVHADETRVCIQGVRHYAWVLTDGKHVVFKLSDTRQISTIEPLLVGYGGVLVSDFYSGYDSLKCRQQKCLVHLIRDLNDDLWSNPFHEDYEGFVAAVRDLLVPIFEDVDKWGLKARFLRKHMKSVDRFYGNVIDGTECRSELVAKYGKRFKRYRESLFLFLTEDGIPWNNNTAERALRHLSVQRKISGFFVGTGANDYLRLLGICQTCRFQDKPFLQFLLSDEKNVDEFKAPKRRRKTP